MNRILKILGFIIYSVLLIFIGIWMEQVEVAFQPTYEKEQIYSRQLKESIYLKSKTWGISSDHRIYVISTNDEREFEANELSEYVFHGFGKLYYRHSNDSITFYVTQRPDVPKVFPTRFHIEFVELSNPEYLRLQDDYEKGMQRFNY